MPLNKGLVQDKTKSIRLWLNPSTKKSMQQTITTKT